MAKSSETKLLTYGELTANWKSWAAVRHRHEGDKDFDAFLAAWHRFLDQHPDLKTWATSYGRAAFYAGFFEGRNSAGSEPKIKTRYLRTDDRPGYRNAAVDPKWFLVDQFRAEAAGAIERYALGQDANALFDLLDVAETRDYDVIGCGLEYMVNQHKRPMYIHATGKWTWVCVPTVNSAGEAVTDFSDGYLTRATNKSPENVLSRPAFGGHAAVAAAALFNQDTSGTRFPDCSLVITESIAHAAAFVGGCLWAANPEELRAISA
jgi:hypothetical protein